MNYIGIKTLEKLGLAWDVKVAKLPSEKPRSQGRLTFRTSILQALWTPHGLGSASRRSARAMISS